MKKFLIYLAIILGVALFACIGLVVFLMVAPGTEVFGIKYISAVVGEYQNTIHKTFTSQDIYIYADNVPINISFAQTGTVGIEYAQHYQGFTRAKDVPEVIFKNKEGKEFDASRDSDCVKIYVNQYKKFVWSNDVKDFYFNLNLPYEYKNNATIYVETNNSVVTLSGSNKSIKSLTVKTDNNIEIKNNVTIENITLETQQGITLGSNVNIAPLTASGTSSVNVSIPNENLTIVNPIKNGDLTFNTAGGNLRFSTCRNLTVTSGSGNIEQPSLKYISGNLKFTTTSGSVSLDNIKGTKNEIKSTAGAITIGFCDGDLEIVTNRANVKLGTINNANISTTTGNISATYINGNIVASSTRSGDVLCGRVVGYAQLSTKIGTITLSGAVGGDLSLNSTSGNLEMVSCDNLKVKTEDGYLKGYNSAQIVVNGVAEINAGKGAIKIAKILGSKNNAEVVDNTIVTTNGDIEIGEIVGTSKIESYNAPIKIAKATKHTTVKASYSPIEVGQAPAGVTISNISGAIMVGNKDNSAIEIGKVDIKSSEGTINVYHTTADVYLFSHQAIYMVNKSSSKVYINTTTAGDTTGSKTGRGQVTATRLMGEVRISSQHDVILTFAQVSGHVRIDTTGASSKVVIDATCADASSINYLVQSSKSVEGDLYIGQTKQSAEKFEANNGVIDKSIRVYTTYAKITLKLS